MPPKLDVIGNPITVLQLELAWKTKPEEGEVIVLDVMYNKFSLMYVADGQNVIHGQGNGVVTHVVVARWDGFYWHGQLYWASFAKYFSTASQTIWIFSRLLVNHQYENLILDHARTITQDVDKPRWYYVGQSGVQTHWSVDIDGHPTLFHSNPKED